jgi:hypothetical protein
MKKRFLYQACDREWEGAWQVRKREIKCGDEANERRMFDVYSKCRWIPKGWFTSKAFSLCLHQFLRNENVLGNDRRHWICEEKKGCLRATQKQIGKRLGNRCLVPEVWSRFKDAFLCTCSSVVHPSTSANCICWIPTKWGIGLIPMRSSEICCRKVAEYTHGGWVKMETWGKFFVDCLLKTAPYGVIEYTPKRWFPPICEKGDYFDPVLTDEEIAKHEQLSKQWKSEEERVSILLGLPLDVVNESPDGE